MTSRLAFVVAALLMAAAVGCGAFGAHALRTRLGPEQLAAWQTAVSYHGWHALGLLIVGLLMRQFPAASALRYAAWLLVAGIVLFSGSLYWLALGAPRYAGFVTPFGGVAFIAAWIAVAIGVARHVR